jgi:1-deoxy-D-xylulose-5-phosphate synthase
MVTPSLAAGAELDATVANMRFVKPLDEALILDLAGRHALLVTVEENTAQGGAGSAVAELLEARGVTVPLLIVGLPDVFLEQGDPAILLKECGLTKDGIVSRIRARLGARPHD